MSKSKKRKKTSNSKKVIPLKPHNYIQKIARKLPIHECIIDENWSESGMTSVIVSRKRKNGNIVLGIYIVDAFCLGVKNTLFQHNLDFYDYEEAKEDTMSNMELPKIVDPVFAFNLIYGAVEYAEDLGFEPHKDFKITEYILDDVESLEVLDIPFGKDGKPLYISGPYDSTERILKILEKNVGVGNFDYIAHIDQDFHGNDFDDDEDIDWEEVFTDEQIEKKLATFDSDDVQSKSIFKLLTNIAEEINDYLEGDLSLVMDDEFDIEEMFLAIGVDVLQSLTLDGLKEGDAEELDETTVHFVTDRMRFIFEKLFHSGNFDFLIDPDFIPIVKEYSEKEFHSLSEEEQIKHFEQTVELMTLENQFSFVIGSLVSKIIDQKTNDGQLNHISTEIEEEIFREMSAQKEQFKLDVNTSEIDEEYTENVKNIIHDLVQEYNDSKLA